TLGVHGGVGLAGLDNAGQVCRGASGLPGEEVRLAPPAVRLDQVAVEAEGAVEADGLAQVGHGPIRITGLDSREAALLVGEGVPPVELDRFGQVGQSLLVLSLAAVDPGTITERPPTLGVELYGLGEVAEGLVVVLPLEVCLTAQEICASRVR